MHVIRTAPEAATRRAMPPRAAISASLIKPILPLPLSACGGGGGQKPGTLQGDRKHKQTPAAGHF